MSGTDITVYSRWDEGQTPRWVKTEMRGASWYGGTGTAMGPGGPGLAGRWAVRIPESGMPPGYTTPGQWRELDDPAGRWTLRPGDVVAKGHGLPEAEEMAAITGGAAECFVVDNVWDNRRGAGPLRHLRVEGGG